MPLHNNMPSLMVAVACHLPRPLCLDSLSLQAKYLAHIHCTRLATFVNFSMCSEEIPIWYHVENNVASPLQGSWQIVVCHDIGKFQASPIYLICSMTCPSLLICIQLGWLFEHGRQSRRVVIQTFSDGMRAVKRWLD